MSWIKINHAIYVLSINVLVLCGILLFAEISARLYKYINSCLEEVCNTHYWKQANTTVKQIGFLQIDPILGYSLKPMFNAEIIQPNWDKNSHLNIDAKSFRKNDNGIKLSSKKILAIGDSFTFGSQVDNRDTWPSCLERKTQIEVHNAGVPGYGIAQAVRRGQIISNSYGRYNAVILSILVNSNLERAQDSYRGGLPKLSVIKSRDSISFSLPPDDTTDTKFQKKGQVTLRNRIIEWVIENSFLANKFYSLADLSYPRQRTEDHLQAASIEEILRFSLKALMEIRADEYFVLLQYYSADMLANLEEKDLSERKLIKNVLLEYPITLIDSYDAIQKEIPSLVWRSHHTPLGNIMVCDAIISHENFRGYFKLAEIN